MPGQGRLGDKANISADSHGCPGCPHPGTGPAIAGSPDVFVNGRPALRVDDVGIHAICCGPNMWTAKAGSSTVFINGKAAHRMQDTAVKGNLAPGVASDELPTWTANARDLMFTTFHSFTNDPHAP